MHYKNIAKALFPFLENHFPAMERIQSVKEV